MTVIPKKEFVYPVYGKNPYAYLCFVNDITVVSVNVFETENIVTGGVLIVETNVSVERQAEILNLTTSCSKNEFEAVLCKVTNFLYNNNYVNRFVSK